MFAEVRESPAVKQILDDLWDRGGTDLVERIEDCFDDIRERRASARQHHFRSTDLLPREAWGVVIADRGQRWMLVWNETEPGVATVHGIALTKTF